MAVFKRKIYSRPRIDAIISRLYFCQLSFIVLALGEGATAFLMDNYLKTSPFVGEVFICQCSLFNLRNLICLIASFSKVICTIQTQNIRPR